MSSHDDLMKAAKEHEAELNRQLTTKDDILIPVAVSEVLNGWHEFLPNWELRSRYLRVVPTQEQQTRLDFWDRQIARFDNNRTLPVLSNWGEE